MKITIDSNGISLVEANCFYNLQDLTPRKIIFRCDNDWTLERFKEFLHIEEIEKDGNFYQFYIVT